MPTATQIPSTIQQQQVVIAPIQLGYMRLRLIGDAPLICHAWSHKARQQMLDKQMKKGRQAKEAKDPERDYQESLYHLDDGGYGFPVVAFKAAVVSACRFSDGMKMTAVRGAFHIQGEMARINGAPSRREDMVRVGMGTADIRYRGEFKSWSVDLDLRFNSSAISPSEIVNLFNIAGFGIGVGEWRPERDGSFGLFHVWREGED